MEWLIIVAGACVGAGVGVALYRQRSRSALAAVRQQCAERVEGARETAALTVREAEAQAGDEALRIERATREERGEIQQHIERIEKRLRRHEELCQQLERAVGEREQSVEERERRARERRAEAKQIRAEAKRLRGAMRGRLEERAGETAAVVSQRLSAALVDEVRSACADRLRNLEQNRAEELSREAKRVMGIAMQRYTGHFLRERGAATYALDAKRAAKLEGEHAEHLEVLQQTTDVSIVPSAGGDALRLESSDGVSRELCRRVIDRLLAEKKPIRNVEGLIRSVQRELEREVVKLGRSAFDALDLPVAADEVVDLLGRLNWRTSYTQNQYRHSIEAGALAGMMAAELEIDIEMARRSALLHDIGKALTPAVEGSHALIGAELARKTGEDERVANAIGAHHGEEPMGSPYAWLTAAADAMSGGRPGARREMVESYSDRMGDLERIAISFRGVESVHAVQAGREIRVHVDDKTVSDDQLDDLSSQIAARISDEMTFPGQVRVTVIRQFRAVATAN